MTYNTSTFERAIIHINTESFFAALEQKKHAQYRDKALVVVTMHGKLLSISSEAKKLGVSIAMSCKEIKKLFPTVILLVRERVTYASCFGKIEKIIRRYTEDVEVYGDMSYFADVTGLRTLRKMTYTEIADAILLDCTKTFGVPFVGCLSTSKVLAHLGSTLLDGDGLSVIGRRNCVRLLKKSFVEDIWNISKDTIAYLNKVRIYTGYDLMKLPLATVEKVFQSPIIELWKELNGISVWHDLSLDHDIEYNPKIIKSYMQQNVSRATLSSNRLSGRLENFCTRLARGGSLPLALQTFEERIKRHLIVPYIGKVS